MSKKVLVTGGAGFIGFHASLALQRRGDRVIALDNFNSYYSPLLKQKRGEILRQSGIEVIEGDITNTPFLKELLKKEGFTHILHLAAQAGVRYAKTHPEAYLKSNIEGFLSILESLRLFPHIKLVYASSSSVYGCNDKIPFSQKDPTDRPANFYAVTKKTNELMAYSYCYLYGIRATGLRFFTVYGPWGRPDMAYFSFTKAILEGAPITLFNQGEMERDFTYIDDALQATLQALDLEKEENGIYNIGNNHPEPLLKLVSLLEEKLEKKAHLVLAGPSKGEVKTTFADIEEAKKELQFEPKTGLSRGLDHFISWYVEYGKNF